MSFTVRELREVSEDVLITRHDELARHTSVGTAYYLDELKRRDQARAIEESHRLAIEGHRLAKASFWLTIVNAVVAVVAVVIAVAA